MLAPLCAISGSTDLTVSGDGIPNPSPGTGQTAGKDLLDDLLQIDPIDFRQKVASVYSTTASAKTAPVTLDQLTTAIDLMIQTPLTQNYPMPQQASKYGGNFAVSPSVWGGYSNNSTTTTWSTTPVINQYASTSYNYKIASDAPPPLTPAIRVADGNEAKIELPDGTRIEVEKDGSFKIIDDDAKVIYRARRIREFNPYLNASDMLEEFIRYLGSMGVRQRDLKTLPIELFIKWLIIRAAEADEEEPPDDVVLQFPTVHPRCEVCQRFIRRDAFDQGLKACSRQHEQIAAGRRYDTLAAEVVIPKISGSQRRADLTRISERSPAYF